MADSCEFPGADAPIAVRGLDGQQNQNRGPRQDRPAHSGHRRDGQDGRQPVERGMLSGRPLSGREIGPRQPEVRRNPSESRPVVGDVQEFGGHRRSAPMQQQAHGLPPI